MTNGPYSQSLILSVLDTGRPEETVDLARRIEATGYDRIWVTEHHTESQSACPSIMAASVLASTNRLSVTVGGVLARIHSPFFIAEQLKLLAKLHGDRIQFGVAGTLPAEATRDLIGHPVAESPDEYQERLLRLRDLALRQSGSESRNDYLGQTFREPSKDQPAEQQQVVGPVGAEPASFCICGTSEGAATFTGQLGFPFAFHDFHSPLTCREDRIAVCQAYRNAGGRRLSVAVSGICAESEQTAEQLWGKVNQGRYTRRPSFLGNPEESAARIAEIATEMTADEIVIQPLSHNFDQRLFTAESLYESLQTQLSY